MTRLTIIGLYTNRFSIKTSDSSETTQKKYTHIKQHFTSCVCGQITACYSSIAFHFVLHCQIVKSTGNGNEMHFEANNT